MDKFWFWSTCNKPRLRDPTAVKAIIARHWFDFDFDVCVERAPDGHQLLKMEGDGWPGAWQIPAGASPDDFQLDFEQDELENFEPMLLAIAPFLAEPLIVQAVGTVKGAYPLNACQWRVEPCATQIEKVEFTSEGMAPPPSPAAELVLLAA